MNKHPSNIPKNIINVYSLIKGPRDHKTLRIEYVSVITIASFKSLGIEVKGLEVVCHDLPPQSPVDGLLGINFLIHYPPFIEFYSHIRHHT